MTAAEARAIANRVRAEKRLAALDTMKPIHDRIALNVGIGNYDTDFNRSQLNEYQIQILKELGYTVTGYNSHYVVNCEKYI